MNNMGFKFHYYARGKPWFNSNDWGNRFNNPYNLNRFGNPNFNTSDFVSLVTTVEILLLRNKIHLIKVEVLTIQIIALIKVFKYRMHLL